MKSDNQCILSGTIDGGGYEKMLEADRRVYSCDGLSPTIRTVTGGNKELKVEDLYGRIRKLTPRECWRLMGFSDDDFDRARQVNSDTELFKQAGNSIVVNVLEAIFKEMIN